MELERQIEADFCADLEVEVGFVRQFLEVEFHFQAAMEAAFCCHLEAAFYQVTEHHPFDIGPLEAVFCPHFDVGQHLEADFYQQLEADFEVDRTLEAVFLRHHLEAGFDQQMELDAEIERHHLEADFDQHFERHYLVAALNFEQLLEAALRQFLEAAFARQVSEADFEWQKYEAVFSAFEAVFPASEAVWQLGPVAITAGTAAAEVDFEIEVAEGSLLLWLCSACSKLCLLLIQVLPILWQWQSTGSFLCGFNVRKLVLWVWIALVAIL